MTIGGADQRRVPARQRVAVIVPAHDEARRVAATVRAARAIPLVDLVVVVDDGSSDETQHVARAAGAVVVRQPHQRGRAAALETGAVVVAMRDVPGLPRRLLLIVDASMAEAAVSLAPLITPVAQGEADVALAVARDKELDTGADVVTARRMLARAFSRTLHQPLNRWRCMTAEAFETALPLASGAGLEAGQLFDVLARGYRVVEVACELPSRADVGAVRGPVDRANRAREVMQAILARRVRHSLHTAQRPAPTRAP